MLQYYYWYNYYNMINLKTTDSQVDHIIHKIMKNKSNNNNNNNISQELQQKYGQSQERKIDSRLINCSLQDKNIQLRKEFKRLEKILNSKIKFKKKVDQTILQIDQIRDKLRNVLNVSQSLELQLVRYKKPQSNKIQKSSLSWQCCCSRRYRQKQAHKQQSKQKQKCQSSPSPSKLPNPPKPNPQIASSPLRQCNISPQSLFSHLNEVASKKSHINKLRLLIQNQQKMLESYQKQIGAQANVGKFTKVGAVKGNGNGNIKLGVAMKTCASIGSIVRNAK